jgi:DNA-binding XRE family transcriptional regulator
MIEIGDSRGMQLVKVACRTKLDAINLCKAKMKQGQAATILGISSRTIRKAERNLQIHSDVEGGRKKRGLKLKMTEDLI